MLLTQTKTFCEIHFLENQNVFFVLYIYCILTKMKCVDPAMDADGLMEAGVEKSIIRFKFKFNQFKLSIFNLMRFLFKSFEKIPFLTFIFMNKLFFISLPCV